MCGFSGEYCIRGGSINKDNISKMGNIISHRGPNYTGYYFNEFGFGACHNRLSIIDLSEDGNQPMSNDDGSLWIVFNGEITNYIELKKELEDKGYNFKSKSDTEVILKMYECYGLTCLERLNGMFAFIIWDTNNKRVLGARDRIGIKPFYYTVKNDHLIFASEIKALLAHPMVVKDINSKAIFNYLNYEHQIDNQSWFKDVYSLQPGEYILIENYKVCIKSYWKIKFSDDNIASFNSLAEELRENILDSVKNNWRSDVPVGAHLSGGVDSSTIVAIASSFNCDIHTFSSAFDLGKLYDERKEIEIISKQFHTIHHQISIDSNSIKDNLSNIIWYLDEPTIGPAILPMYNISKLIKDSNIIVVNGGQGVDELFAGYPTFYSVSAKEYLSNLPDAICESPYLLTYLYKGGVIGRYCKLSKTSSYGNWIKSTIKKYDKLEQIESIAKETNGMSCFESYTYTRMKYYLPALLQQEDRLSMAWSVESRVPFLDNRIVDIALKTPYKYKIRHGMTKAVFREAMKGLVPQKILYNKIKRGYPTPVSIWFSKELYSYMYELLTKPISISDEYVERKVLLKILNTQRTNPYKNISAPLWRFLVLDKWLELNFGK